MQDFSIHDITVMDIPGVSNTLHPSLTKRVIFFVGSSGPFQLNYAQADYSAAKVRADMQAQVVILRDIAASQQGS